MDRQGKVLNTTLWEGNKQLPTENEFNMRKCRWTGQKPSHQQQNITRRSHMELTRNKEGEHQEPTGRITPTVKAAWWDILGDTEQCKTLSSAEDHSWWPTVPASTHVED